VAAVLSPAQIEEYYIPLLKRLSSGEWFTSRTSSAALYPPVYAKVSPAIQEDLRKGYAALGSDDTPMVRRAAAKWLGVSFLLHRSFSPFAKTQHATLLASREESFEAACPVRRITDISQIAIRRSGLRSTFDSRGLDHDRRTNVAGRSQGTIAETN
jgi:hypothetical protein